MAASQAPKLTLIAAARLLFTMYCVERSTPSEALVFGGDDEFDGRALGHAAGPFHVQIGLHLFARADDSGVLAVEDHLRIVARETEGRTERRHVAQLDVGAPGDGHRLAGAVKVEIPQMRYVVDGGEIVRAEPAGAAV